MGSLLSTFTFDRNTFRRTAEQSADSVAQHIALLERGGEMNKTESNIIGALGSYMGLLAKTNGQVMKTPLADVFLELYASNKADAWRWLVARSLWRFVVPNGTAAKVNGPASQAGVSFEFFRTLLQLLTHLSAEKGHGRFLFFEELCRLLDDDSNWGRSAADLFAAILQARSAQGSGFESKRGLLSDLDDEFKIPRDNLNGLFSKAFAQTGFFETRGSAGKSVGIALQTDLDPVLQRRLRFILDHPVTWTPAGAVTWEAHLDLQKPDLPQEVTTEPVQDDESPTVSADLKELIPRAYDDINAAGLVVQADQLLRFVASLQSKRFLIITGLAGSGKTKMTQAFARWITSSTAGNDPFFPGAQIESDRISYYVTAADAIAVEFRNKEGDEDTSATKVVLPRAMIEEWAALIETNGLTKDKPAKEIRWKVAEQSRFSSQLHSFETHLKAAAFALIQSRSTTARHQSYSLVPVGADWTGNENIIGHPDALRPPMAKSDTSSEKIGAYVSKPALDLMVQASRNSKTPYFLILDEMNLSHVERYFADLLSMIESEEPVTLYCDEKGADGKPINTRGVEPILSLPNNMFIIGTVNVDETTYMFSPKVLDRANVIEFRVPAEEMSAFLSNPRSPNLRQLEGKGVSFAEAFVATAAQKPDPLTGTEKDRFDAEINLFYAILRDHGAEFGYRVAHEAVRFLQFYKLLGDAKVWTQDHVEGERDGGWAATDSARRDWLDRAFDAVVVQKFLPKLHGSKVKLGPLLKKLYSVCVAKHDDTPRDLDAWTAQWGDAKNLAALKEPVRGIPEDARYPIAAEKIFRMWRQLNENGFASFAEN